MGLIQSYLKEKYRQDRYDRRQRERMAFQREKERNTAGRYCPKCGELYHGKPKICTKCGLPFKLKL